MSEADHITAASKKPLPLKKGYTLDHLPHVAGVELLPSGGAALHLEGGGSVEVPQGQNAAINLEYTPLVLRLDSGNCFVIPEPLRLPIMRALGFDLSDFEGRPDLPRAVAVELLPAGAARLTLDAGYTFTLSREGTPRASLAHLGADGHALLLTDWKSTAAPVFLVPSALYDELFRAELWAERKI